MARNRAFTLVELLVVIAIIALLAALVTPYVGRAKYLAMEGQCAANLHHVGQAVGTYMAVYKVGEPWRFNGDSVDAAHESSHSRQPGNPARALTPDPAHPQRGPHILDDPRVFFCPLVPISYAEHYERSPPYDYVTYWGTYVWHYKKVRYEDDPLASPSPGADGVPYHSIIRWSNDLSRDLLMVDTRAQTWEDRDFGHVASEHYNALMLQGNVQRVSRDWQYMQWWLWGEERRPYVSTD